MNPILRPALVMVVLFTAITGILYPLAVTLIGGTLFPFQANGSLIRRNGLVIGSRLIAQPFRQPDDFWPRPSAVNYNAAGSGGSNLGPDSKIFLRHVKARLKAEQAANPEGGPVPVGLLETSASGLDPDISPAAALYQIPRIAKARRISRRRLEALVHKSTQLPTFGFIGEPRVNVLELNLELDGHNYRQRNRIAR